MTGTEAASSSQDVSCPVKRAGQHANEAVLFAELPKERTERQHLLASGIAFFVTHLWKKRFCFLAVPVSNG